MIIWRGWGLVVLGLAIVWIAVAGAICFAIAAVLYPGMPNALDLVIYETPYFSIIMALTGFAMAWLTWITGRAMNRNALNEHTLFFIPVRFWAIAFALLGVLFASQIFRDGTDAARTAFIGDCTEYEEGWLEAECTCLADRIEAETEDATRVRFYIHMTRLWGRDDVADGEAIPLFFEEHAEVLSASELDGIRTALAGAQSCLPQGI